MLVSEMNMETVFWICLYYCYTDIWVRFMVLSATFNNMSVISWQSVLLVEETGVPGAEKTTDLSQVTDTVQLNGFCVNGILARNFNCTEVFAKLTGFHAMNVC